MEGKKYDPKSIIPTVKHKSVKIMLHCCFSAKVMITSPHQASSGWGHVQ